ncbi:MAG: DUF58 domain-containing protein [Victivallales bacterium]|nr:DUF58 domain-containing protein [Victivallales bacterium]
MPTRRGKIVICFVVASFFVAMVNPNIATALVFSVSSAVLVSSFLLSVFSMNGVKCSLEVCPDGMINERLCMPLTVVNTGWRNHQGCLARAELPFSAKKLDEFVIPPIGRRKTLEVDCFVIPRLRGIFPIRRIKLIGGDPAGLFSRVKRFKMGAEIKIYPQTFRLNSLQLQSRNKIKSSTNGRAIGISGDGQDIFGVREYRHGDPVRMIHWKASARQHKLVVKEFESMRLDRVTLLLDTSAKSVGDDEFDNNFEFLVKTTASIMRHLAGMYCQLSFLSADSSKSEVISETGFSSGVAREVGELLVTIQPVKITLAALLDYAVDVVPADSILFCLSMSFDDEVRERFDALAANGVDIRWIHAPASGFPNLARNAPPLPKKREDDLSQSHVRPLLASNSIDVSQLLASQ